MRIKLIKKTVENGTFCEKETFRENLWKVQKSGAKRM